MDRLSSCYFCGAAPDATLEEHPVVPESLDPAAETRTTVVLCRTCERKLDAVLDAVVGAVENGDATAESGSGGDGASADPAPEGDAEDGLESTLGDDEEILTPLGDDESTAEDAAEASEMEFGDDRAADDEADDAGSDDGDDGPSKARKYTRSRGAGFRKEDDDTVESGSLTGGAFDDDDEDEGESGSLTGDAFSDDGAGTGGSTASGDESSDPLAGGSTDGSAEGGTDEASPENEAGASSSGSGSGGRSSGGQSSGDTSDSDGDGGDHRVSMSRLENTKVMRLLENREFPVDKAEFVTVAANAYQVSKSDCEKVIDLAVEHGLLREENGQLYGGDA
ncbi:hypothetical protein [Halosimplex marinum]|uniref:hypothetical protein n=1 Tax=Halosimplex marinum TaxID=3396620 RepID=UPI003F54C8B2